jgi:hypothetical protein
MIASNSSKPTGLCLNSPSPFPLPLWFVHYDVLLDLFQMPKIYPLDLLLDDPIDLTLVPEHQVAYLVCRSRCGV